MHEQLYHAANLYEMAVLAENYLSRQLKKQKSIEPNRRITAATDLITQHTGLVNIDALAGKVNMGLRSFERHFNEITGMSPKLFCCITRFNHALEMKLRNSTLEWTSIAYQMGYFDQMHLIKDFKKFCGDVPSSLIRQTPLLKENYVED